MTKTGNKALFFLEALIAMTPDELGRVNSAIRAAADHTGNTLPSGANVVIAEGIADPEIAAMLEQYEQRRREGWSRAGRGFFYPHPQTPALPPDTAPRTDASADADPHGGGIQ
ncbi:MAG: hypothetical protein PHD67_09265 [Oscillospiraceae bacterium]|nr:hypothetical protein [Oscillospiraceae bacterium]